jgi:hypothetical protein
VFMGDARGWSTSRGRGSGLASFGGQDGRDGDVSSSRKGEVGNLVLCDPPEAGLALVGVYRTCKGCEWCCSEGGGPSSSDRVYLTGVVQQSAQRIVKGREVSRQWR